MLTNSKFLPFRFPSVLQNVRSALLGVIPSKKPFFSGIGMSSPRWSCSNCTFLNPQSQTSCCEMCLSPRMGLAPQSSAAAPLLSDDAKWSCSSCTFLNPYTLSSCEICGTRYSTSLLSVLELSDEELRGTQLGSSAFLPLKSCGNNKSSGIVDHKFDVGHADFSGKSRGFQSSNQNDSGNHGFIEALRPCSNKRKERGDDDDHGIVPTNANAVGSRAETGSLVGGTHSLIESKVWKIMTYNVWFREDVEMHNRMRALGNLVELHSPDAICFQEVTPDIYQIFRTKNWWRRYSCSISDDSMFPGGYFCMQLSKLPVKSFGSRPFHNSIMGRELLTVEAEIQPDMPILIATSHLESPCPAPPKWDQMFSKERVVQANEAMAWLGKHKNVIFCGDMNWDDKLDGAFPLPDGWIDAWTELKPGDNGFTYDTKANKMLHGNRTLQKRLDRFVCKMKDFKVQRIEMIGKEEIPGVSYMKEKRVKGKVKQMELPVFPSDHFGLILTIGRRSSLTSAAKS